MNAEKTETTPHKAGPASLLADLVGQTVDVHYAAGYTDRGIVEAVEGPWIRLRKADELLICSAHTVRLIKIIPRTGERDEDKLLRPADKP